METRKPALNQMDADNAIKLAKCFVDAWNPHDIEALMTMFHPQGILTIPAIPNPLSGDAMRGYLEAQMPAFPDIKAEAIGETLVGSDTNSGRHLITGTWSKPMTTGPLAGIPPSGKSITLQVADFLDVKVGKIGAWTQYYDRIALLTQLGIISPK